MADRFGGPAGNKAATTSLLLSPPGSGFSFDEQSASAVLVPVLQSSDAKHNDGNEADCFIGQSSPQPFTFYHATTRLNTDAKEDGDPFSGIGKGLVQPPPRLQQHQTSSPQQQQEQQQQQLQQQQAMPETNLSSPPAPPVVAPSPPYADGNNSGSFANLHLPLRTTNAPPSSISTNNSFSEIAKSSSSSLANLPRTPSVQYKPVQHHWFFCKEIEKKQVWMPFSLIDSIHLEDIFNSDHEEDVVVPTDGGRYNVHLNKRLRYPVYWEEEPTIVRRCSWFYRGDGEKRNIPYEEHFAAKLEEEYRTAMMTNTWYRRLEFPGGETIIIHNPSVVVHFLPSNTPDEWGNVSHDDQLRPRAVKRGIEDFDNIEDGEAMQIDHLVFVVHGIGGFCDLKFRTVTEVVDDFRSISNGLLHTHFRKHVESQAIGRVEFLPISWHKTLHGDNTGIDSQLQPITLPSIPKLRYFSNDTILDVLFYTSPVYCQTIVEQVCSEINRMYQLFLKRNPSFTGNVSLIGHSLGSVILFDILLHQPRNDVDLESDEPSEQNLNTEDSPEKEASPCDSDEIMIEKCFQQLGLSEYVEIFRNEKIDYKALLLCTEEDLKSLQLPMGPRKKLVSFLNEKKKEEEMKKNNPNLSATIPSIAKAALLRRRSMSTVNYMVGLAGTGQPFIYYPPLDFHPSCFFALGSPTSMFFTVRGLQQIGSEFKLPTCPAYFNIFHPFDPVAYRMEPLIEPTFTQKPVLIPHHKGRKRMHLEIKESLAWVASDFKQLLLDSLKSTWNSINEFARAHRPVAPEVEAELDKIASYDDAQPEEEEEDEEGGGENDCDSASCQHQESLKEEDIKIGSLNGGRRFDYVLQEKPIESFNEYLFALQSHMCYWESEDTVLMVLSEIYATMGIKPTRSVYGSMFPSKEFIRRRSRESVSKATHRPDQYQSSVSPPNSSQTSLPVTQPLPSQPFLVSTGPPPSSYSTVTTQNVSPFPSSSSATPQDSTSGMDPTLPAASGPVGPPPLMGFVRQPIKK